MTAWMLIVAGAALVIGALVGFVLGQAYANIYYEGKLRTGDANRATLANKVTNMTYFLRTGGLEYPPASPPASADKERE